MKVKFKIGKILVWIRKRWIDGINTKKVNTSENVDVYTHKS